MRAGLQFDVSLSPLTTLGVGGPATVYGGAESARDWQQALDLASQRDLPLMVLGGGSNVVIADAGLKAVVAKPTNCGWTELKRSAKSVRVRVEAGTEWDDLVAHACSQGWAGLECLSGIPGLVGAAPIQNVGAYGQEVGDVMVSVALLNRTTRQVEEWPAEQCQFGYRDSVFKREAKDRYVVLSVDFELAVGGAPKLAYAELVKAVDGPEASLSQVRKTVIALRRRKAMVLVSEGENSKTAGSFFTNPIVPTNQAKALCEQWFKEHGEKAPCYPAYEGTKKLAAGWLIERSGMHKGFGEGPVGLSTVHCLALVNRGGATAKQVLGFAEQVQRRVRNRFGVALDVEPQLLGFTPTELMAVKTPSD